VACRRGTRQRQGLEVVQHQQRIQAHGLLQGAARELPGAVGQPHLVALDGGGDSQGGTARCDGAAEFVCQPGQVGRCCVGRTGVVGRGHLAHVLHGAAGLRHPAEAGVGPAHVGHQPGQAQGAFVRRGLAGQSFTASVHGNSGWAWQPDL